MHSTTDRQIRALEQAGNYALLPTALPTVFRVEHRASGLGYQTSTTACTCPDHRQGGRKCKHIHLVRWEVEASAPSPVDTAAVARYEAAEALPLPNDLDAMRAAKARRMAQDFPAD